MEAPFSALKDPSVLKECFVLRLPTLPKEYKEETLCHIGGCVKVELVCRSFDPIDPAVGFLRSENSFYFNKENEWMLLTTFTMRRHHSETRESFTLSLPLSMPRVREMELYLYFDGVHLKYLGDGEILNQNEGQDIFLFDSTLFVKDNAPVSVSLGKLKEYVRYEREEGNADFYSPLPYNAFVGDVMNFYHNGVYHLLYLLDRRHHGSRGGAGAHYIAHVTTRDFKNWREEEPVVSLDVPYESHGTGTMFYHNGKYYMSYGLHTERYAEDDALGIPPYFENGARVDEISEESILKSGKYPAGATYAVSEDGIHFEKSHKFFHAGRNPSVYANEKGGISLYVGYEGKGTWESLGFGEPFRLVDENFPPISTLPMRQTGECPSFFSMNGYRYLVMGFTGYFRTLMPYDTKYTDVSAMGEEIYDGLCVPMVASVGERRLISGWLDGTGWGSVAIHRELLCLENGRLGMRWMPELVPETLPENLLEDAKGSVFALPEGESLLFCARVDPQSSRRVAFCFAEEDGKGCEISFDIEKGRMQAAPTEKEGFAPPIPTMLEQMEAADPSVDYYGNLETRTIPRYTANFSLGGLGMLQKPFSVRVLLRQSKKFSSSVIDVEVAGERTLITVRRYLFPKTLALKSDGDATFSSLSMARLAHKVK